MTSIDPVGEERADMRAAWAAIATIQASQPSTLSSDAIEKIYELLTEYTPLRTQGLAQEITPDQAAAMVR